MRQIGRIKQVQVQRSSLKRGVKPARYYDPAPIQLVERLLLAPEGVTGISAAGESLLDIHNSTHPESKNIDGINGISLSFTSHYRAMRTQFGSHLLDGIAGENILIETEEEFKLEALGEYVALQAQEGGKMLYLEQLEVAAPCIEFSLFALGEQMFMPAELVRATLIFLNEGRRGFYATFQGEESFAVCAGMGVFIKN
ncbi:MAG TPA: hypothetical protein VGD98_00690 [Ktedonobacteraceae bacterium]